MTGVQTCALPIWPVTVVGALTVIGGPKSAAVTAPDGTLRRFYSTEAPEAWFEDFGRASLTGGTATVTIEAQFGSFVDTTSDYYVFVQPENDTISLTVTKHGPTSFEVRDLTDRRSDATFSYRIVARRKDLAGHGRLELFTPVQAATLSATATPLAAPADVNAARQLFTQQSSDTTPTIESLQPPNKTILTTPTIEA